MVATTGIPSTEIVNLENVKAYSLQFLNNAADVSVPSGTTANSALDYYEVYTHVTTLTNPATPPALTVTIVRLGRLVTMQIAPLANQTMTNAVATFTTALPARFCPAANMEFPIDMVDNTTVEFGAMTVTTAGVVTFGIVLTAAATTAPAAFTAAVGNPIGTNGICVQWIASAL